MFRDMKEFASLSNSPVVSEKTNKVASKTAPKVSFAKKKEVQMPRKEK